MTAKEIKAEQKKKEDELEAFKINRRNLFRRATII